MANYGKLCHFCHLLQLRKTHIVYICVVGHMTRQHNHVQKCVFYAKMRKMLFLRKSCILPIFDHFQTLVAPPEASDGPLTDPSLGPRGSQQSTPLAHLILELADRILMTPSASSSQVLCDLRENDDFTSIFIKNCINLQFYVFIIFTKN